MNIAIIGAGPIGCYAGYLLAKVGNKVQIFENHSQVGLPIQCVLSAIEDWAPPAAINFLFLDSTGDQFSQFEHL